MNPAATSRMQLLARAGLALAACLLMLPTPGHAVTLNVTDDAFIRLSNPTKNFGSRKSVKVDGLNGLEGFAKFDLAKRPAAPRLRLIMARFGRFRPPLRAV